MFNGIWLVACEPLTIRGREIQPGERFEVPRVRSGDYLLTQRATIAPRLVPKAEPSTPAPEPPPVARKRGRPRKTPIADEGSPAPKGRYQRRDLQADE